MDEDGDTHTVSLDLRLTVSHPNGDQPRIHADMKRDKQTTELSAISDPRVSA